MQTARPSLISLVRTVLPLGLWALLWFGLLTAQGETRQVFHPTGVFSFFQGLRASIPYAAVLVAVLIICYKLARRRSSGFALYGPLGLTIVYGGVGVASSLLSPQEWISFYWATAYLAVPLVLWAVVWGSDPLEQARRLVNFNWLIILSGIAVLFATALLYLNIDDWILNPSEWLNCGKRGVWYQLTQDFPSFSGSGQTLEAPLRNTGVGRYAAIGAIIALGGLWQPRWRVLWGSLLVVSLLLLLHSGARTAFLAFVPAATLVWLLAGGRRAAVAGGLVLLVVAPLVWFTGTHKTFLDQCMLSGYTSGTSLLKPQQEIPPQEQVSLVAQQPPQVSSAQTSTNIPAAELTPPGDEEPAQVTLQSGLWIKKSVPKGFFTLSGRTVVWEAGWNRFKESPIIGYGFHADRLLLGTHMHNAVLHASIQTGLLGTIPFIVALLFGWILLFKGLRNRVQLPVAHQLLLIQTGGILAFLSMRALPESTGAFFGPDWLILGPVLLYLQVINHLGAKDEAGT